jgi:CRISPR/Cas system-associated endonuclease Cas1
MEAKIKYNDKDISWADLINHQANLLAKYLVGDSEYKGFYRRW